MSPPFLTSSSPLNVHCLKVTVLLQPPTHLGWMLPSTRRLPRRVRPPFVVMSLFVALSRWNEYPNSAPYGSPSRASVFTYQLPPSTIVLIVSLLGATYSSFTMLALWA